MNRGYVYANIAEKDNINVTDVLCCVACLLILDRNERHIPIGVREKDFKFRNKKKTDSRLVNKDSSARITTYKWKIVYNDRVFKRLSFCIM